MILQALKEYYDRLTRDPEIGIPRFGFSREKISWAIVVDREGNLVPPLVDLRYHRVEGKSRKPVPKELIVPQRVKKAVNIAANFLWGDTGYVLGADAKGKPARTLQTFEAFRARLHRVGDRMNDAGMRAVLKFADGWDPARAKTLDRWSEIVGTNVVFRLDGDRGFVHERKDVREAYLREERTRRTRGNGMCLVTGERIPTARLHPSLHGVRGAQSSGASLISFNLDAFCSYGKEQGENAPVGEYAAFAYTTALNWLLRSGSGQKMQIADATTVFWTERPSRMEHMLFYLLNPPAEKRDGGTEGDRAKAKDIGAFLHMVCRGETPVSDGDGEMKFYILGLSPNAARISVRFWQVSMVRETLARIGRHYRDMRIEKQFESEPDCPGILRLLSQTALQGKLDNISPLLGGSVIRSILTGGKYPDSLLTALIGRIRSEQDDRKRDTLKINYYRMSFLKGVLVRNHNMEVPMSLDKAKNEPAYLLGRLFSVFERAQEDALGGQLNTTIKDRYFSSASATPRTVFPILLRLNQHHVARGGHGDAYNRIIGEIMELLPAERLPVHMTVEDQGLFAIGYYHQRNDLVRKHIRNGSAISHNKEKPSWERY